MLASIFISLVVGYFVGFLFMIFVDCIYSEVTGNRYDAVISITVSSVWPISIIYYAICSHKRDRLKTDD